MFYYVSKQITNKHVPTVKPAVVIDSYFLFTRLKRIRFLSNDSTQFFFFFYGESLSRETNAGGTRAITSRVPRRARRFYRSRAGEEKAYRRRPLDNTTRREHRTRLNRSRRQCFFLYVFPSGRRLGGNIITINNKK